MFHQLPNNRRKLWSVYSKSISFLKVMKTVTRSLKSAKE